MSSCYSCLTLASKTWKYGWLVGQKGKWNVTLYIPWSTQNLPEEVLLNIIGFHALTGRDTVSSLFQWTILGSKACWKVFCKYPDLLNGVGRDGGLEDVEEFVWRLCKYEVVDSGVNNIKGQNSMFAGKLTWQVINTCPMWMSFIPHREHP